MSQFRSKSATKSAEPVNPVDSAIGTTVARYSRGLSTNQGRNTKMLWTIFVILLVLWLVGLVSSYTMGGFIHLLLVLAVIVLVINLLTGRRAV
jgi:Flp pilus assembly protein TadB